MANNLWFGTRGPHAAKIMIVGEAWGAEEFAQQLPFVGTAGRLLDAMLREADIDPTHCFYTNLIPDQPPNNDFTYYLNPGAATYRGLNPKPELITSLKTLYQQIATIDPRLIIACGNYPLWALTDCGATPKASPTQIAKPTGIGDYHGSQLWTTVDILPLGATKIPVLPIYHPAAILREWSWRHTTVHDLRIRVPKAIVKFTWMPIPHTYLAPPTFHEVVARLATWTTNRQDKLTLALDIENAASPRSILTCIGLADSPTNAISIPFVNLTPSGDFTSYWPPHEERMILRLLDLLFSRPHIYILGQNLVYDCQWLYHTLRMRPKVIFDTMIAQNLLFPGTRKSLGELSAMYCNHHRYWKDDNHDWTLRASLTQHLEYNCEDVCRTMEIAQQQMELLAHFDLLRHLPFEMEKFALAREMNERGLRRNQTKVDEAGRRIIEQMQSLGSRLSNLVKQEWIPTKSKTPTPWYRSDAQIKYVLYTLLALPEQTSRITGRPSSGKEALANLKDSFPRLRPLFNALADYGSLDTIYSTFIKAKPEQDGRIHASFNPAGTATFRWSSSKNAFNRASNMQNIPVGGDEI